MSDSTQSMIGKTLPPEQGRDAVHMAVIPAIAGHAMRPGEHVAVKDGKAVGFTNDRIGIIDPFMGTFVAEGDRVFVFLYPNTITSLRHVWTHPAFPEEGAATVPPDSAYANSRLVLESIAANCDLTFNALMEAAEMWDEDEEYTIQQGSETWRNGFSGHAEEFWKHWEIIKGRKAKHPDASFFSCSC